MLDSGLDASTSQAALQAASVGPQMSTAERLRRWADNIELREQLELSAATPAGSSPLSVAFADWAFQAEGLKGDEVGDALAFFGLSEHELEGIVGSLDEGCRTVPGAMAAERIRALADQGERTRVPYAQIFMTGASVAAVLGVALVASS